MPGFTAEASFYPSSGQYQTARHASNPPAQGLRPVHLAMEVIEVVGCPPGFVQIGQGENTTCWPLPQSEGWIPPGPGPGPGAGDPLETGPRGGGHHPPGETRPPGTPFNRFTPRPGKPCNASAMQSEGVVIIAAGTYRPPAGPGKPWACCGNNTIDGNAACVGCQRVGKYGACGNGWPCGPSGVDCP